MPAKEEVKGIRVTYQVRQPIPKRLFCEACGLMQPLTDERPIKCAHCGNLPKRYFMEGTYIDGVLILERPTKETKYYAAIGGDWVGTRVNITADDMKHSTPQQIVDRIASAVNNCLASRKHVLQEVKPVLQAELIFGNAKDGDAALVFMFLDPRTAKPEYPEVETEEAMRKRIVS